MLARLLLFSVFTAAAIKAKPCILPPLTTGVYIDGMSGVVLIPLSQVEPGKMVNITCQDGFTIAILGRSRICDGTEGIWRPDLFGYCLPTCGRAPQVQNGQILDGDRRIGAQRRLICNPGFRLSGASVVNCGSRTQTWSSPGSCFKLPRPLPGNEFMQNEFNRVSKTPMGIYRYAAVASDAGICSEIGTDMLGRGGSAVDAAVATFVCDNVVNFHFGGIGGGFFMTIWDQKNQQAFTVDSREVAPLASTEDMFENGTLSSVYGSHAIAVPGSLAGLSEVHAKFGQLPWKTVFEPSIKLCQNGFKLTKSVEIAIDEINNDPDYQARKNQAAYDDFRNFTTDPKTGKPYRAGDTIFCPKFALTLSRIADNGAADFYYGALSREIVSELQEIGSPITLDDFGEYKVQWREPVEFKFPDRSDGLKMFSMRPPGSGAILAFMLNILSGYGLKPEDGLNPLTYHRLIEAFKFAYAKRTFMGDSSFQPEMDDFVANLTSPTFGNYIRSLIDDTSTQPTKNYAPDVFQQPRTGGTSHMSFIDGAGNAVAVTSTINTYFGSLVFGKKTGIYYNNQMDDFSTSKKPNAWGLVPSRANAIRPGKRPVSSMCPTIFVQKSANDTDYSVRLVVGGAGGSKITSGVASVAMRNLFLGQDVKQAIDASRIHHQLYPEAVQFEHDGSAPTNLLEVLKTRFGHAEQFANMASYFSVIQAIERTTDPETGKTVLRAMSDPRQPQGYTDGF